MRQQQQYNQEEKKKREVQRFLIGKIQFRDKKIIVYIKEDQQTELDHKIGSVMSVIKNIRYFNDAVLG